MKNIDDVDFSKISFVLMDMDGVLTDGSIIYTSTGEQVKIFHAHDGFGIRRGHELGLTFGVISGKSTPVNNFRVEKLKIAELYQDAEDKVAAYEEIRAKYKLKQENFCFIGDDVFDLPLLRTVAFSCAPPNAVGEVRNEVHYVTKCEAGRGTVREIIDLILRKKGLL
jgi:3-deoxy-D-manno-octulosonate 8-phosphate phosphatase (KDO 8-P phosphatase)